MTSSTRNLVSGKTVSSSPLLLCHRRHGHVLVGSTTEAPVARSSLSRVAFQAGHSYLGRDYFVRIAGSDYSVDPVMIGRMVDAVADLETVTVAGDGRQLARHPRSWTSAATVIDAEHVAAAARLRAVFQQPRAAADDPLRRDLSDYDRAFGVTIDGQVA